jgi:hypothetical protein
MAKSSDSSDSSDSGKTSKAASTADNQGPDPAEEAREVLAEADRPDAEPDGDVKHGTIIDEDGVAQARRNAGLEPTSGDYAADDGK